MAIAMLGVGAGVPPQVVGHAAIAPVTSQVTLNGPSGSVGFGSSVLVLSNGNYVVADPTWSNGAIADVGAVRLYDGDTGALISTLSGSQAGDRVGAGTVTAPASGVLGDDLQTGALFEVGDSDFIVASPSWSNGATAVVGAVTWVDGDVGLNGAVSASNSLVGVTPFDQLGSSGIRVLDDGDYVVTGINVDSVGSGFAYANAGAVTWADGRVGLSGPVSIDNSLLGHFHETRIGLGGIVELADGDYVVVSPNAKGFFQGGTDSDHRGVVTLGDGAHGTRGEASAPGPMGYGPGDVKSWEGSTNDDHIGSGGIVALPDGGFVILSPDVDDAVNGRDDVGSAYRVGPDGDSPNFRVGLNVPVGGTYTTNGGLHGVTAGDRVGGGGAVALTDGSYVVISDDWQDPDDTGVYAGPGPAGAVTWLAGGALVETAVTATNSLHGGQADAVGSGGVVALPGGHYVVSSPRWEPGAPFAAQDVDFGAVTWMSGGGPSSALVAASNSVYGDGANAGGLVTALVDGNYLARFPGADAGALVDAGAVVWADGTTGRTGPIEAAPALRGSQVGDLVGYAADPLPGGRYAVHSPFWDLGAAADVGAMTWMAGGGPATGTVTSANSLHGTHAGDSIGLCICSSPLLVTPLGDGNLVIASPLWDLGATVDAGAITWFAADGSTTGAVSPTNSLHGSHTNDRVGIENGPTGRPHDRPGVVDIGGGNAIVVSYFWDDDGTIDAGAVSLLLGQHGSVGPINAANSAIAAGSIGPPGRRLTSDAAVVVPSGANKALLLRLDESPFFASAPPDVIATAPIGKNAIPVNFAVPTASDRRSAPTVSCTPAPNSSFAIGSTSVSCTATDSAGLTAVTNFHVLVATQPISQAATANLPAARCDLSC